MTLRRQLLLVSLLLLTLPWAGCQFVREMEGALRNGQEQSLQATAQAIAAVLGQQGEQIYPFAGRRNAPPDSRQSIYAQTTEQPVIVDGYGDGWENIPRIEIKNQSGQPFSISYATQLRGNHLYLLFNVQDRDIVYHNPGLSAEPNGDRLVLRMWYEERRQDYVISTAAPGSVRARPGNRRERDLEPSRVKGFWQDAIGGYTLELELPLQYTGGRLGFYFINELQGSARPATQGTISPLDASAPPWLIYSPLPVKNLLKSFESQHNQIQLVDNEYWQLGEQSALPVAAKPEQETFWILRLLYRSILSQDTLQAPPTPARLGKVAGEEIDAALAGRASNERYGNPQYGSTTTLAAAAPITDSKGVLGAVVVRQSGETYLSLTDQAFGRLLGYSLLALGIGALGLLGYATLLSWRIRRLSQAARSAIGDNGRVIDNFPRSAAKDEIGDLSRHYANLLERIREYNDYLRTLSRKLSHELRTPIAVIQSSLDNLEQEKHTGEEHAAYLQRARGGLSRLQHILTAMSEASRLEESINANATETLDLAPLVREMFAAYRDVYSQHRILLALEDATAMVEAVPDLVVQSLDKLMENAASFCPPGGEITLQLLRKGEHWVLAISNEGPTLPASIRDSLFEPMVSLREVKTESVHLGLGLHIVRLIADFHRGSASAENLPENEGVLICIALPAANEDTEDLSD